MTGEKMSAKEAETKIRMIVVGVSSGAVAALQALLGPLPADFGIPISIVRHQLANADDYILRFLAGSCPLTVKYAESNETPTGGVVYIAPPDRHLCFDEKGCFRLKSSPKVNFSRPAVDVLFASAAVAFGSDLVGVILTGANADGAEGMKRIKQAGGITIVQNPKSAEADGMPGAAIRAVRVDHVIWLDQIGPFLWDLDRRSTEFAFTGKD